MKKLTLDDFVKRAGEKHDDKYGYDEVDYKNGKTRVKIYCNKCKKYFWQIPASHLQGTGCPECAGVKVPTTDEFIEQAKKIHGNIYKYDKVVYKGTNTKIKIYCNKCKKYFWQVPSNHLQGQGCPDCGIKKRAELIKLVAYEKFLRIAKEKHKNKYGYDKVVYKGTNTKIKIYCNKCKKYFWQTPNNHLRSHGCPKCECIQQLTLKEFIKRAKEKHDNKYGYDGVVYEKSSKKVKIFCKKCKKYFEQRPNDHLQGCGCSDCADNNQKLTLKEFIERAKKIHGDNYGYDRVVYEKNSKKVKIYCKEHKIYFEQTPRDHLQGHGCPTCNSSLGETKTRLLLKRKFGLKDTDMKKNKKYPDLRDISLLSYDIYLILYNILIEYHGIQHYEYNSFFHRTYANFEKQQKHDKMKEDYAKKKGIKLIIIPYTIETPEEIEAYLRQELGSLFPTSDSFVKSWGTKS
jgi:hypothetical protein